LQSTIRFLRDDSRIIQERNADNQVFNHYLWRHDTFSGTDYLLALGQTGITYNYLYDGKDNVSALIDATKAVVASYRYNAFGILLSEQSSVQQPMRFSAQYYDTETGFSVFDSRFYAASMGRWLTRDSNEEKISLNLYEFNPKNSADYLTP